MTQEKVTSLRILQTNKQKTLSPVMYLLIGFFLGIIFAVLIFLLFVTNSSNMDTTVLQQEKIVEENDHVQEHTKIKAQSSEETIEIHHEAIESVEDNNFTQPGSNDLNKFFQRKPQPTVPISTERHISPFANEPNVKPAQTVASAKPTEINKNIPVATNKTVKPTPQTNQTAPVAKIPEAEAPEASVQIKVTQKPFTVNELQ